jgi:cysteine dioxygenase
MSGDISLAKLIDVLKSDWSVINPARMQDILDRLVVTAEEVQPRTLFSEKRYARNLVYKKDREFEIMIMCWKAGQRSSIHDHAGSLGGIRILQGELTECLFGRAANGMIKALSSADYAIEETRVEETSLIHQISNLQAENGKTRFGPYLHSYAGAYECLFSRRSGGSEYPAPIFQPWVRDIVSARDELPEHGENRREE